MLTCSIISDILNMSGNDKRKRKQRAKGNEMNDTQRKINKLLHNAFTAYTECIHFTDRANEYPSEDKMFKIYDELSTEALHECRTWLEAWEIMTDIHMPVYELAKFKESDFEAVTA